MHRRALTNGVVDQLFVTDHLQNGAATGSRPFLKLLDLTMAAAEAGRLRKHGGRVWRPVPGCPGAYAAGESFRDFLNATLEADPTYHSRPALQTRLIKYLTSQDPPQMRELAFDRGLLSFADGVLVASLDRPEWQFVPYGSDAFAAAVPEGSVARHHIDLPFAPPSTPTPLFDSVVGKQLSPEVARTLWIMLGRLMFPLGTHDHWRVIPWLVGATGTGKSLVQDVAAAMFAKACVATLSSNHEKKFGLDGKYASHLVLGRNLPHKMASTLAQELGAETVHVHRNGQPAVTVRWRAPMLFASNGLPDYAASSRRLVPFAFDERVSSPDPLLLRRILATELPAIVAKALEAYLSAARENTDGFWGWCPAELGAAAQTGAS